MNRIYRLVLNRSNGLIQVTSELGSVGGKHNKTPKTHHRLVRRRRTTLAAAITMALALPLLPVLSAHAALTLISQTGANGNNGGNANSSGPGSGGASTATNPAYANAGGSGGGSASSGSAGGLGGGGYGAGGAGGAGGQPGGGYSGGYGGGGGSGGAPSGQLSGTTPFQLGSGGTLAGGNGGYGGNGYIGYYGGNGGNGGNGGVGISGSGFTLSDSGTITGGKGGMGGSGGLNANLLGSSGYGGNGGNGGGGISGSGFTLSNSGTITGGTGGFGSDGRYSYGGNGSNGGNGGNGGAGVTGSGFTLSNSGTITGGTGGIHSLFSGGTGGAGGVGVISTGGSTIVNSGSIAGGIGNGSYGAQADAIDFSGSGNTLVIEAGAKFTGNVVSTSGTTNGGDTLALGGSTNSSFNVGTVGSGGQFRGFNTLAETGTATWTVSGTNNSGLGWHLNGGTLSISSATGTEIGNYGVTFNGGTLLTTGATTLTQSIILGSGGGTFDNGGNNDTLSGALFGSSVMNFTGSGTTVLSGNNTSYSGTLAVTGGTLSIGSGNNVANVSSIALNGGTLLTTGAVSMIQGFTLGSGGGTFNNGGNNDALLSGIGGSGAMTFSGTGITTLNVSMNYVGPTTVSTGTLKGGAADTFSPNSVTTVDSGGTLDLGGYAQTIKSVALAGGTLQNGVLTGAITSAGGTISNIIGAPTLTTTSGTTTTFTGTNVFGTVTNAGTIINNGTGSDALNNIGTFSNNNTYTADISSNIGTLTNTSTGTWNGDVLSGANVAGGQVINQGIWKGATSYNNGGVLNNSGNWTGAIVNAAGTFINTGTLNGNLTNAAGATARLGAAGVINGNVSNSGTLSANGAIGMMSVNGNYTQSSSGTLKIEVTPTGGKSAAGTGYDQLNVTGSATLAGTLAVQVGSGTYTVGTKYDIVQAGKGISGQFSQTLYNPAFAAYITPKVTYGANDVYLTLNPKQAAFTSGQGTGIATWGSQLGLFGVQHYLLNVQGGTAGGILKVNGQPDPAVWSRVLGSSGSADGANLNNQTFMLGYGTEIRPGLIIGGVVANTQSKTTTDVQTVKTKAIGVSAYTQYTPGHWTFNAALSAGSLHTDSTRSLPTLNETASGSAGGSYAALSGEAGYRLTRGRLFILPHAVIDFLHTRRDAYTERGAGMLNLSYGSVGTTLTALSAGVRLGTDILTGHGLTVSPWINLGAVGYGGDRDPGQSVTLGTHQETLPASGAPTSAGQLDLGVALMSRINWSAQLAYRGQFGSGTHLNTADLKVVYRW